LKLSYAEQIRRGADLFHGLAAHGAARVGLVAGISAMARTISRRHDHRPRLTSGFSKLESSRKSPASLSGPS